MALQLKPVLAEEAKKRQGERNDLKNVSDVCENICQKSDECLDTKHELARLSGVSHDTIAKVEKLEAEAAVPLHHRFMKQLGRRNLTDEQRTVLIGKMYEARKKTYGASDGFRGNQVVSHQNEDLPRGRTAEQIAQELGISKNTVERAEQFAKGVDKLKETVPEAAVPLHPPPPKRSGKSQKC